SRSPCFGSGSAATPAVLAEVMVPAGAAAGVVAGASGGADTVLATGRSVVAGTMAGEGFGVTSLEAIAGLTIVATGVAWIGLGGWIVAGAVGPACGADACNGSCAVGVAAGALAGASVATRGGSGRTTAGAAPSACTASALAGADGLAGIGVTATAGVAFGAMLAVTVVDWA